MYERTAQLKISRTHIGGRTLCYAEARTNKYRVKTGIGSTNQHLLIDHCSVKYAVCTVTVPGSQTGYDAEPPVAV